MTKKRRHLIFSIILITLTAAFIWLNSAMTGETSSFISTRFKEILESVLNFVHFPAAKTEFLLLNIRKVAHAVEYAVIGAEIGFLWAGLGKKFQGFWNAISMVLAIAVSDESIQLFATERGPQITDVLLDTASGVSGILAVYILWFIIKSISK